MFKQHLYQVIYKDSNGSFMRDDVLSLTFDKIGALEATVLENVKLIIDWVDVYLLQSTGAFDKNGRLIYHGDILKFPDETEKEVLAIYSGYAVIIDDTEVFLSDEITRTVEVVGNSVEDIGKPVSQEEIDTVFMEVTEDEILEPEQA